MRLVLPVQPFPGGVQSVAVEHGKFTHADQASARARVIAPLGLDVIDQGRELAVRTNLIPHQRRDHLFVGHRQHHIAPGFVFETSHFRANLVPASGFLPDIRRLHHRHGHFLPANGVDLFAHDRLDARHDPAGQRQV